MKKHVLGAILAIIMIAALPSASAWLPYTHTWICDQAGLSGHDCNQADNRYYQSINSELSTYNHLCINDTPDCKARELAGKWLSQNVNVSLNLWADSMSPVHWKKFDNVDCQDVFEDCIDSNLRIGNTEWKCQLECVVPATGEKIINKADYAYMLSVADYVKKQYAAENLKHKLITYGIAVLVLLALLFIARSFKRTKKKRH